MIHQERKTKGNIPGATVARLNAAAKDNYTWRYEKGSYVVDGPFGRLEKFAELLGEAFPIRKEELRVAAQSSDKDLARLQVPKSLAGASLYVPASLAEDPLFVHALRRQKESITAARERAGIQAFADLFCAAAFSGRRSHVRTSQK